LGRGKSVTVTGPGGKKCGFDCPSAFPPQGENWLTTGNKKEENALGPCSQGGKKEIRRGSKYHVRERKGNYGKTRRNKIGSCRTIWSTTIIDQSSQMRRFAAG